SHVALRDRPPCAAELLGTPQGDPGSAGSSLTDDQSGTPSRDNRGVSRRLYGTARRSRTFYRPCGRALPAPPRQTNRVWRDSARLSLRSSARGDRSTPRGHQRYHATWGCERIRGFALVVLYLISYVAVDFRRSMCPQVLSAYRCTALSPQGTCAAGRRFTPAI